MPINAKIKKTGELFEAINEENLTSAVYALEEGKSYSGFLYPGHFDSTKATDGSTIFRWTKERTPAIFSADELEQIPLPVKIANLRPKKND